MAKTMTAEQKLKYMTKTPLARLILTLSVPTIISMLITSFYNMADTFFVGLIGSASASLGTHGVTVDGTYHYLAPAANMKELTAVAKCVKSGIKICVFDVEVLSEEKKVIGKGTFTTYRLLDKPIVLD